MSRLTCAASSQRFFIASEIACSDLVRFWRNRSSVGNAAIHHLARRGHPSRQGLSSGSAPRRHEAPMPRHRRGTAQSSAHLRTVQCKLANANGLTTPASFCRLKTKARRGALRGVQRLCPPRLRDVLRLGVLPAGTFLNSLSSSDIGGQVPFAGLPGKLRLPKEGSQTMRGAPLALVRLSSLSAAATLFLAACGGGAAQPTAAPAAPATTAPAKPTTAAAAPSPATSPAASPAA